MSDNINTLTVKRMDQFRVDAESALAVFGNDSLGEYESVSILNLDPVTLRIEGNCERALLEGKVCGEGSSTLMVTKMEWGGVGSGRLWEELWDLLADNTAGELVAVVVWDSGEVKKLSVKDGVVKTEEIEV